MRVTGAEARGTFVEVRQVAISATEKHMRELYDAEEVATSVDMLTGKEEEFKRGRHAHQRLLGEMESE